MNHNSRLKNSALNLIANVILQLVSIVVAFIVRRVFISSLGVEFLGIAGLFNNILAVLSLAEMGVGTAMSYSMYKAVAESDKDRIAALNHFYKSIYNRIALFVFLFGIAFMPFLSLVVNLDRTIPHLYLYYLLEIINSVVSYLFVYKTTIVNADQSGYKLSTLNVFLQLTTGILQIVSLIIFKKYMIYLLIGIGITFINNFIKSYFAEKWYPFIKNNKTVLPEEEKKEIWKNIKSMFAYKVGGVILNNTDSILISVIVNTTMVGIYSNYLMIYNKANAVIGIVFGAVLPSIGNFNVNAKAHEKLKLFKVVDFISYILYSYVAICIYFCGQDIIKAITGTTIYLLSNNVLIVTIIYFYLNMLKRAISIFRETTGLFKYGKYSIILSAIFNIIFSIVLGKIFGIIGILAATILARMISDVWYEPYILHKKIFDESPVDYFKEQLWRLGVVIAIILFISIISKNIIIDHLYIRLLVNGLICTSITTVLFFVIFRKSEEYQFLKLKMSNLFLKFKDKYIN